ncbi:MAG: ABC transporter ATP-binding protein, partial [Lachnospiraceae bacterium]
YILDTIMKNFNEGSSILLSTHLIADVERVLDEVIFMEDGRIHLTANADELRNKRGKSINEIFREEFKC